MGDYTERELVLRLVLVFGVNPHSKFEEDNTGITLD